MKSAHEKINYASMFMAGQFTMGKIMNQPRCPPTDDWI